MVDVKFINEPLNDNVFYDDDNNAQPYHNILTDNTRYALSDTELESLSVAELNQRLQFFDEMERSALKRKRRALKNRFYAKRCRLRRVQIRRELEMSCQNLMRQYQAAIQRIQYLQQELSRYTQFCRCQASHHVQYDVTTTAAMNPYTSAPEAAVDPQADTPPYILNPKQVLVDQNEFVEIQNDLLKNFELLNNIDDDWLSC
uniref:BZIP domain-containing protein n=1 Tax=Romanomermis culicivorax TaxID=13658 RepID=A0A915IQW7_ROMCU